jgi:hypothetical protein
LLRRRIRQRLKTIRRPTKSQSNVVNRPSRIIRVHALVNQQRDQRLSRPIPILGELFDDGLGVYLTHDFTHTFADAFVDAFTDGYSLRFSILKCQRNVSLCGGKRQ